MLSQLQGAIWEGDSLAENLYQPFLASGIIRTALIESKLWDPQSHGDK
jgi:hypothetical protein